MRPESLRIKPKATPVPIFPVRLVIAFLAGLSLVFAFAPYYIWVIALLSPCVLYAVLLTKLTQVRSFLVGWAYGFGVWLAGAFWLYHSIYDYGDVPAWLAFLMIVAMAMVMGLFHGVMAWAFVRFFGRQPLGFASLWAIQEWTKTWVLTGFPWLFLGYAYTDLPFITSIAPITGVLGISFLSALFSASFVDAFRKRAGYLVISSALLGGCILLYLINPKWTTPTGESLSVSLVQGNVAQSIKWDPEHQAQILATYASLSSSEWGRDLVIWSEGAIPLFQDDAREYIDIHAKLAKDTGSAWITGLPYKALDEYDPNQSFFPPFYNAVWAMGQGRGIYKKQRLVPFGEYTPFEGALNILPNLANHQEALLSHSRGQVGQELLTVKDKKMGVAICYEVAYPEITRKNAQNSDFMLTVSNDAWFGTSAGPYQHLQMVQMRAIETGKWFVRGTNNGVTAIINHKGEFIDIAPQFKEVVLRSDVVMMAGETPFVKWGQLPFLLLMVFLSGLSVWAGKNSTYFAKDGKFTEDYR